MTAGRVYCAIEVLQSRCPVLDFVLMLSTPLLSVGLFVYNGDRFLEEALESVLNQTFTDFELIISDNASTDRTGKIAETYTKRDRRIRYYRAERNMGAGWNIRRVYELANGKYFKWAAADDFIEREFLERCVDVLEADNGCVLAYAGTKMVDENGTFFENYVTPMRTDSNDPIERFRDLLLIDHPCFQIFGVMRMSALRQLPPQGSYVSSDKVLVTRMSLLGRFYEIPERLFVNRRHSGQSIVTSPARLRQPRRFRLTTRPGTRPPLDWWDSAKARAIGFPEYRLLLEYFLSIYHSRIGAGQKLRCYFLLLPWIRISPPKIIVKPTTCRRSSALQSSV